MGTNFTRNARMNLLPAGIVAIAGLTGVIEFAHAQTPASISPSPQITFTKDIAPILQRSCQNCHRAENMAPMPLLTYKDARPWARSIKNKVIQREMPPWFIDKTVASGSSKTTRRSATKKLPPSPHGWMPGRRKAIPLICRLRAGLRMTTNGILASRTLLSRCPFPSA